MPTLLYNDDCLRVMPSIADGSVDLILCDLPYGVLNRDNDNARWDCIIPMEPLWEQYRRIIKDNGAIILFVQGMFTAELMKAAQDIWRHNLIWDKERTTGFLNANRMPLRRHQLLPSQDREYAVSLRALENAPADQTQH